jgi:hypothetical protein
MRVNRGGTGDESSDQGDGSGAMRAPGAGSSGSESPRGSGATRAPSGGGSNPQRQDADSLRSRTDRGNQNDEGIGSSAARGGGGGESNAPRSAGEAELDDIEERQGPPGSSDNPDLTGTTDELEQ